MKLTWFHKGPVVDKPSRSPMLILCQFDHLGCGLVGQYQPQSNIRIANTRACVNPDKRCCWLCTYVDREICILTFKYHESYIYRTGVPVPSRCCILYIFSTNICTEYFKHAAHSRFFSTKCRLFHNATFFWCLYYSRFTYRVC